jgi:transposase
MSDNTDVNEPTPIAAPDCPRCAEFAKLVLELQAQVKELRAEVRDLKARLNTHSGNSSLPPSADPPSAPKFPPKPPTGRKPGGQPGHTGHSRVRLPVERVDQVIQYIPAECERCQASLPNEAGVDDPGPTWHQVAELPSVAAIVTEHQGHGRHCACCGHVTWAKIPDDVRAHAFGPKLAAAAVFLSSRCHGSKRVVAETFQTLFGVPISLGSISNLEAEAAAALAPAHAQAEQAVRAAAAKNADETGWSIAGKLCWLWLVATNWVAYFKISAGRGQANFRALLGEHLGGIIGSDRWHAYNVLDLANRQLCWAHLKRDFQKWLDHGGEGVTVGQSGLDAVKRIFELWRDFRQGMMDRPALQVAMEPVCNELRQTLESGGRCTDKRVGLFCRKILAIYPALWTFTRIDGVEPTNNHAERTLRLAVIWRKISFGSHSDEGCRFAERILTVVQTLRLQKRNVMNYLEEAFATHRNGQPIPSLLPAGV